MRRTMCGFLFVILMLGIGFLQVPGARGTTPDDTLVIGYNRISNNLTPGMTTALPNIWANMLLYDALVIHDFEGKVHPALAKRWETTKDGLTWTFHLRDDVKFHSGRKFTAKDVKAERKFLPGIVFFGMLTKMILGENCLKIPKVIRNLTIGKKRFKNGRIRKTIKSSVMDRAMNAKK